MSFIAIVIVITINVVAIVIVTAINDIVVIIIIAINDITVVGWAIVIILSFIHGCFGPKFKLYIYMTV